LPASAPVAALVALVATSSGTVYSATRPQRRAWARPTRSSQQWARGGATQREQEQVRREVAQLQAPAGFAHRHQLANGQRRRAHAQRGQHDENERQDQEQTEQDLRNACRPGGDAAESQGTGDQ